MADSEPKNEAVPNDGDKDPDLNPEEREAFAKIMSEIDGTDENVEPESKDAADSPDVEEELSDDELEAFNSIMAEINTDEGSGDKAGGKVSVSGDASDDFAAQLAKVAEEAEALTTNPADDETDDATKSDDGNVDEAAGNRVSSEMDGSISEEEKAEEEDDGEEDDGEEDEADDDDPKTQDLNDDELDAFNAIMAEITGNDEDETDPSDPDDASSEASEKDDSSAEPAVTVERADNSSGTGEQSEDTSPVTPNVDDTAIADPKAVSGKPDSAEAPEQVSEDSEPVGMDDQADLTESKEIAASVEKPEPVVAESTPELKQPPQRSPRPRTSRVTPLKTIDADRKKKWKKPVTISVLVVFLLSAVSALYLFRTPIVHLIGGKPYLTENFPADPAIELTGANPSISVEENLTTLSPDEPANSLPTDPPPVFFNETLELIKQDILALRERLLEKENEIATLQDYYRNAITEIEDDIKEETVNAKYESFQQAITNKRIELNLRTIQRRLAYIEKLDQPTRLLHRRSEQLLFLQRKTEMYEMLMAKTSGIVLDPFKREVDDTLNLIRASEDELSIDQVKSNPPSLNAIWNSTIGKMVAQQKNHQQLTALEKLNLLIWREFCEGDFSRKTEMTDITPEAARCLVNFQGKDLYLNGLTRLSPESAKILSKWPGSWLSLNGIEKLSSKTAAHLAQWEGRRLSLNGLKELTPKTTAMLSNWKGEQLELIGLERIGNWENPDITLYLPDTLKKSLAPKKK
ncbi:MAG: hypothetical protein HKM93_11380 [Desulfobacteraceae bacterium]|nr:hypothetical protein [Desulfobacteraceae bacterium]